MRSRFLRMMPVIILCLTFLMSISLSTTQGQDTTASDETCSAVVQKIKAAVDTVCTDTQRDQACYGNISVQAAPKDDAIQFDFQKEGDIVNLADVRNLQLRTLDFTNGQWGVALMRVKASLPDNSARNTTLFLMGNVEIDNQGTDLVELPMTAGQAVNVRLRAAADGALLGSLPARTEVVANGRITNAASETWVRIKFDGAPGNIGWVLAAVLNTQGDINSLAELKSSREPAYGPMQAFTFSSKKDDQACQGVPDSGLLIQTPAGVGEVNFLINEVDIRVGSTAYLQAQAGGNFAIRTLEGRVVATSGGVTRVIPAGSEADVPLDDEGTADGPPSEPEPYQDQDLSGLDEVLSWESFEEAINVQPAWDDGALQAFNDIFNNPDRPLGDWFYRIILDPDYDTMFDNLFADLQAGNDDTSPRAIVDTYFQENLDPALVDVYEANQGTTDSGGESGSSGDPGTDPGSSDPGSGDPGDGS